MTDERMTAEERAWDAAMAVSGEQPSVRARIIKGHLELAERAARDAALEEAADAIYTEIGPSNICDRTMRAVSALQSTPATTAPHAAEKSQMEYGSDKGAGEVARSQPRNTAPADDSLPESAGQPSSSPTLTEEQEARINDLYSQAMHRHVLIAHGDLSHRIEKLAARVSDLEQQGQHTHNMVIAAERETDKLAERIAAVERTDDQLRTMVRDEVRRLDDIRHIGFASPPERSEVERRRLRQAAWQSKPIGLTTKDHFEAGFDAGWDAAQSKDGGGA